MKCKRKKEGKLKEKMFVFPNHGIFKCYDKELGSFSQSLVW